MIEPELTIDPVDVDVLTELWGGVPSFPGTKAMEMTLEERRAHQRRLHERGLLVDRAPWLAPHVAALLGPVLESDRLARVFEGRGTSTAMTFSPAFDLFARGDEFVLHVEGDGSHGFVRASADTVEDLVAFAERFDTAGVCEEEPQILESADLESAEGETDGEPSALAAAYVSARAEATHMMLVALNTGMDDLVSPVTSFHIYESDASFWVERSECGTPWWDTRTITVQRTNPGALCPLLAATLRRVREPLGVELIRDWEARQLLDEPSPRTRGDGDHG